MKINPAVAILDPLRDKREGVCHTGGGRGGGGVKTFFAAMSYFVQKNMETKKWNETKRIVSNPRGVVGSSAEYGRRNNRELSFFCTPSRSLPVPSLDSAALSPPVHPFVLRVRI